ncbi:MAG: TrbI/VirB10 family protein [Gammaproteobacteria bacterium]|nr:TrbI/VirB10 family protein [Gammaproteobacteria bacterium]
MDMNNFKSLFKKKYPMTTKARKFWVVVVGIAIPIIVLTIIANLAHSKNTQQQENQNHPKVQQLATSEDTNWYKNETPPPLPDLPNKPLTAKQQAQLKNLILGKGAGFNESDTNGNGDDETEKAMKAAITSNQITNSSQLNSSEPTKQQTNQNNSINPDYLGSAVQNPVSPYELQAGSIIPAVLITGINSDLPGQIIAEVTENIYDSVSGNNLLIPQGTKVIGSYDSKVAYGQERVLIAWKRLIFPNGQSVDLNGMPGVDISGYAGFSDEVNNHYGKIFGSVILMSLLSSGAQLSQPQNQSNDFNSSPSVNQILAQSLGTNIANTANSITQKNVNIQPTLEIRPGYQFNISVTKDIVFDSVCRDRELI